MNFFEKTIELCRCDGLCMQYYDLWMGRAAKASVEDYL